MNKFLRIVTPFNLFLANAVVFGILAFRAMYPHALSDALASFWANVAIATSMSALVLTTLYLWKNRNRGEL